MNVRQLCKGVALVLLFIVPLTALSTTVTFTQTSWSGGATVNTATHTSNQTGWTEYSAKDALMSVVNSGVDIQLATTTATIIQTNEGTTNTGFNLTGATFSTTTVVGSGTSASVRLAGATSFGVNQVVDSVQGDYGAIALDSNNKAHISYHLESTDDLKYATNASGSWSASTVYSTGAIGTYTDIAIDSNNKVHMSFSGVGDLLYATNATTTWNVETADGSAASTGSRTSIGLDSNNKAHISYYDATNSDLVYATNASGSWATTTIDGQGVSNVGLSGTSLAVDSNDKVHIAYHSSTALELRYATNISGSWATTTPDTNGSVGASPALAIDSDNNIHISYIDASNRDLLYINNVGGSWNAREVVDAGTTISFGDYSSIALDSAGTAHISYWSSADGPASGLDLRYATSSSSSTSWATSTLASTGDVGRYSSIDVDSTGLAHVTHYDQTNADIVYLTQALTYNTPGTFTSGAIYPGVGTLGWGTISFTHTGSQTVTLKARTDADGDFSNATDWASCTEYTSGASLNVGPTDCIDDSHDYIQYRAELSTNDTSTTPSLTDVTIQYIKYPSSQTLTSSAFNTESESSTIDGISWTEDSTLPSNTSVTLELRTASTSAGLSSGTWREFTNATSGCTKASGTVTCAASAVHSSQKDATEDQWFQYRVTLATTDGASTPTVGQVQVSYTRDASVVPTVATDDVTSPTETTATLNGTISGTGGTDVTVRGFAYGTSATLATVIATTTDTVGQPFSAGSFSYSATGLTCGTIYYYRAYATNTAGTGYGDVEFFSPSCEDEDEGGGGGGGGGGGSSGGGGSTPTTTPPVNPGTSTPPTVPPTVPPTNPPTPPGGGGEDGGGSGGEDGGGSGGGGEDGGGGGGPDTGGPFEPGPEDPAPPGGGGGGGVIPSVPEIIDAVSRAASTLARDSITLVASTTAQAVPLAVPLGALSGTLAFVGTAMPLTTGANFALSLARLWHLLLSALGFRKRKPWGVIYDSVTKHPIDPATIKLTDAYGKALDTSYTDFDGRYGFLVAPGMYRIEVEKKNYVFPSKRLAGKFTDGLYTNLYFGGPLTVGEDGVIVQNIPLDPLELDWKEFSEHSGKRFHFYSELERAATFLMRWIFRLGFLAALYTLATAPSIGNASIIGLYAVIGALRLLGFGPRPYGYLTDATTDAPLAFALVIVRDAKTRVEVTRAIADHLGRYYALVPDGEYIVEIARKEGAEEYRTIYTSGPVKSHRGLVKENLEV